LSEGGNAHDLGGCNVTHFGRSDNQEFRCKPIFAGSVAFLSHFFHG
jgi:hypothetical protein